jgi:hypothetical protein
LVEAENAVLNTPINSLAEAIAFWDFASREAAAGNVLIFTARSEMAMIFCEDNFVENAFTKCMHLVRHAHFRMLPGGSTELR